MRSPVISLVLAAGLSLAADPVTLTGKVTDSLGKPLPDALVMIYHAGVKHGYSTFCPSCYIDCGKHADTDQTGAFTIKGLDSDLKFELLVVRDGYLAKLVPNVDPSAGPPPTAALAPRVKVTDPARVVHGRVLDSDGQPVRAAVIEPIGIEYIDEHRGLLSTYGTIEGLEPMAVTNVSGEFELAYASPAMGMLLRVEARAMAQKVITAQTGPEPTTVTVALGGVIRGRLMNHGQPVAGALVGLMPRWRGGFGGHLKVFGDPYDEIRIGTQPDGTFVITNVPAHVDWYLYGKMESIGALGATEPKEISSGADGEDVDAGVIEIHPGHLLRGKVTLSDGASLRSGMRVTISSTRAWDSQTVALASDGSFEFSSLASGKYEIFPSVRGYRLQDNQRVLETTVDRDVDNFTVPIEPNRR